MATLLDEGTYLASERTMYRILAATTRSVNDVPRRATRPTRRPSCSHWPRRAVALDITKLAGTWYQLYVILDVFSRYVPGWMVADRESAALADGSSRNLRQAGHPPDSLTLHADRGCP